MKGLRGINGKHLRAVLRGLGASNGPQLPGSTCSFVEHLTAVVTAKDAITQARCFLGFLGIVRLAMGTLQRFNFQHIDPLASPIVSLFPNLRSEI